MKYLWTQSNTNIDYNSRISICDIKKIEISSWSEQWKSQNIESDLISILYTSYMLFMSYDLEMKYEFLKS